MTYRLAPVAENLIPFMANYVLVVMHNPKSLLIIKWNLKIIQRQNPTGFIQHRGETRFSLLLLAPVSPFLSYMLFPAF